MGYKIELDAAVVSIWTNEIWGKVYNKSVAEFACTHCDNLRDYFPARIKWVTVAVFHFLLILTILIAFIRGLLEYEKIEAKERFKETFCFFIRIA